MPSSPHSNSSDLSSHSEANPKSFAWLRICRSPLANPLATLTTLPCTHAVPATWASLLSTNTPGTPPGLCMSCSLFLECPFPSYLQGSHPYFLQTPLFKCHLIRGFPDHLIILYPLLYFIFSGTYIYCLSSCTSYNASYMRGGNLTFLFSAVTAAPRIRSGS